MATLLIVRVRIAAGTDSMSIYSRYALPRIIAWTCATKPVMKQREKVVPLARGRVLEIGVGGGLNFQYYDTSQVSDVLGLDTSEELMETARENAEIAGMSFKPLLLDAARIPLGDNDIDTVLVTYTLCSIAELNAALAEMRRVLRPTGRLIFCEHGAAPDPRVYRWQRRLTPWWRRIGGGCHLDRDLPTAIASSGFRVTSLEQMYLPGTWRVIGYNSWGTAQPA